MHAIADNASVASFRRTAAQAPMLDAKTESDLLRRVREEQDARALEELLAAHLRLVVAIAGRFAGAGVSLAELIAEGNLGLTEAARRFDQGKGTRFATYAAWWVRARVRRFAFDNRRIVAAPSTRAARRLLSGMRSAERRLVAVSGEPVTRDRLAALTGTSPEDVAMVEVALSARDVALGAPEDGGVEIASHDPGPEDALAARENEARVAREVRSALDQLDVREREIVRRRLLEDDAATLTEIGASLGLSRERVRQLEERAIRKLRAALLDSARGQRLGVVAIGHVAPERQIFVDHAA